MPAQWRLQATLWLPKPPAEVFPFFADAFNLESITPPFLKFAVTTKAPIAMHEGTRIDYRLRIHGVPVKWRTNIAEWDPPRAFVDEQLSGPYRLWHHRHTFEPKDGGTLCRDVVKMRPHGWILAPLLMRMFIERDVRTIFGYRAEQLCARFGGDPKSQQLEFSREDGAR